jgi:hypothetical protein
MPIIYNQNEVLAINGGVTSIGLGDANANSFALLDSLFLPFKPVIGLEMLTDM